MTSPRLLAASTLLACAAQADAANDSALKAKLEAKSQALADPIAPGIKAIWDAAGPDIKWRRVS